MKPLKYQLDDKLVKQIRQDERIKALEDVEKMIDKLKIKDGKGSFHAGYNIALIDLNQNIQELKKENA